MFSWRKNILRRRIGALCLALCGFHSGNLRRRVAIFLFLLQQLEIRFRRGQLIFRLLHFTRRRRAILLQSLQGFEIALGGVPPGAGLCQLRLKSQNFFPVAATLHRADFGLRGSHLGQSPSRLAAGFGVVQLHQQLPFFTC